MKLDKEGLPVFNTVKESNRYWRGLRKQRRKTGLFKMTRRLSGSFGSKNR